MKVYLLKDVQKVGFSGEILKVSDGYAQNFLIPNKLALPVTPENEHSFVERQRIVEKRKEAIATETSMLAEKIKSMNLTLTKKMHDSERIYGSVSASEVVDLLAEKGVKVTKTQIILDKPIKTKGVFEITIKLSSRLQPRLKLKVVAEQ
jgi:large subunit ribosomal protein L9